MKEGEVFTVENGLARQALGLLLRYLKGGYGRDLKAYIKDGKIYLEVEGCAYITIGGQDAQQEGLQCKMKSRSTSHRTPGFRRRRY